MNTQGQKTHKKVMDAIQTPVMVGTAPPRPPKTDAEITLTRVHNKVCKTCDGCSLSRCAFTEGYHRGVREEKFRAESDIVLLNQLISILQRYVGERGDNEGAVEVLERILTEREILLRNAIKEKLFKLV